MIANFFQPIIFLLFTSCAYAYWEKCHPSAYCGPMQNLVAQAGSYATSDDCGIQCQTLGSTFTYFSYVPSSNQCLCTTTCDSLISNDGVDSYCLHIDWQLCFPGQYCLDSSLTVQVGTYSTEQACANQCWWSNAKYNYFNLIHSSQQCQCLEKCSSLVSAPEVDGYSLNGHDCSVGSVKHLRA